MAERSVEQVLASYPPFAQRVDEGYRVTNDRLTTLQINVGYACNLACKHCHLSCSPARTEEMSRETMKACLDAYRLGGFSQIDLTGGAPEMNPHLEWLIEEASKICDDVIVRTNLCILTQPGFGHFAQVYAEHDVTLFASLPYYSARNCDKVRGDGTFMASIEALRMLNELGYGDSGRDGHTLTLVFNPSGAVLPPNQDSLEAEYHARLEADFGVRFTNLVAIANAPGGRFAERLNAKDRLGKYMQKLIDAFNPATLEGMMCRSQVSVDWEGKLYDCDFNQAMHVPLMSGETIFDWAKRRPERRNIAFRNWCYACTAGAGSS